MIEALSGILFGIGFSFIILFFYSFLKRRNRMSGIFSLICLTIAIYVVGYAFELHSINVEEIKFFLKIEYFGLSFMFALWFMFIYKFYYNRDLSLKFCMLLFLIPLLTLFFVVTNEYHHFFYIDVSAVHYNGFIIARLKKGPWYYVHILYSYTLLTAGLIYIYKAWRHSPHQRQTQFLILFFGTLFPGVMELFYLAGLSPFGLDMTPFSISVLAICYYIVLFRYGFFELDEIIRNVIFSEIREGIIVIDYRKRLLDFNHAAWKVFDWIDAKNIGTDLTHFADAKEIIEQTGSVFEIQVMQKGEPRYYEFRITEIMERNTIQGYVYIMRDITEQKKLIQELENMASYDYLTHLFNRGRFMKEAETEALRAKRYNHCLSMLMIDIDFFKKINDKYGHLAGDEVLNSIARVCKERIRRTDIIGRYGGEEFAVLLTETDIKDAKIVAEDIRRHIEKMETNYFGNKIKVTVSIGISTGNESEEIDVLQLINKADIALYDAKNSGRNRVGSEWEIRGITG